ncbi:MAG: ankyrin repeat domain-containing protein [Planctomycetota bacterium]
MRKTLLITICCLLVGSLAGWGALNSGGQPETGEATSLVSGSLIDVSEQEQAVETYAAESGTVGYPSLMSPHFNPIAINGTRVFAVNTPADTVDVIDSRTREIVARVAVGIDPVSIAVRPDGLEVWVSNHVSDSVSVIDTDIDSPTYLQVVATVQEFDRRTGATQFDEPVGIAFAGNDKAYVALSSENEIAVIDVETREVRRKLSIASQDPRAIFVRNGLLYVIPFESNNKTQLSGGNEGDIDGELVTFDAWNHSVDNNNVLSIGHVIDIVKHPRVPDHDLYVFDCETDRLVDTVDTLGTLLYGLTVDSSGRVFIAQTDARNDVNGRAGTENHGLKELENRAFLNQITCVDFAVEDLTVPSFFDLEPAPPEQPESGSALATPFAVQISDDDSTLFVSAAGSDKLFTLNSSTGEILGRVDVGSVPRGIAIQSENGIAETAWVHNSVENSVSMVNVSDPSAMKPVLTIDLEDPTHPSFKRGRIAFNNANASSTGTFSCASCHPDGHTDQLLWVLKTPVVTGGEQIMPRSTMPVRGLRDTEPYHWDGIPGDPYGGNNSEHVYTSVPPNSDVDDPVTSTRHVIDGALASTMALAGSEGENDEGKAGLLDASEREDMAKFLLNIPYPPAQRRSFTNELSEDAAEGFRLFHILGDNDPSRTTPNVCGDCHRMPFLVSTNTPGTGMDAPTWRGAYDRWLILPQGRLNIIDFDFFERVARAGLDERSIWQFSWAGRSRFDPVWNMVLEGSTGFSGAFARQVTLNRETAGDDFTSELLHALESASLDGAVVLTVEGSFTSADGTIPIRLQFDGEKYVETRLTNIELMGDTYVYLSDNEPSYYRREKLLADASTGSFIGTFTARHGSDADFDHPQPAIWTRGPIQAQSGHQIFPFVYDENRTMTVNGRHIRDGAVVYVDGRRAEASLEVAGAKVEITLVDLPDSGMHFLQVQNRHGMFSNDFIFHVVADEEEAMETQRQWDRNRAEPGRSLRTAVLENDVREVRRLLEEGERLNGRSEDGSILLVDAAVRGHKEVVELLLDNGARVNRSNRDGNTALHVAAWVCDFEIVELLLERGATLNEENNSGETPSQIVAEPWSEEIAGFYQLVGRLVGRDFDLQTMRRDRPRMADLLNEETDRRP